MNKLTSPYSIFAKVYDKTMVDVPYHHWAYYIFRTFERHHVQSGQWVMDIGSGTGIIAAKLAAYYKMIAMDASHSMLGFAQNYPGLKCIQAEMSELPLSENSISAAYSTHDCINYLTTEEKVADHLREVYRILKKKGIYILDFSTEYNVIKFFHNRTFQERHGNLSMEWTNVYDQDQKIVTSVIDVTEYPGIPFGRLIGLGQKKYREVHIQKIFDQDLMEKLCRDAGFKLIETSYDYNEKYSSGNAHLVVFVLKKF